MRVLGLCSYPIEAAATRFRLAQFVEPLSEHGIHLTISPFLDREQFSGMYTPGGVLGKSFGLMSSVLRRTGELVSAGSYDVILVQREAMFFGPAVFEWLFQNLGRVPMVLDLDDATYLRYVSPVYGRWGSALKFFGKTNRLIEHSSLVICGNPFIAEYVESKGTPTAVLPTIVDTSIFHPAEMKANPIPVLGWIGTHSTFPFLAALFPVLERLAEKHRFKLRVVGAGFGDVKVRGVETENLEWNLDREVEDFQSLDIGLYPMSATDLVSSEWLQGKSGFKAIQYLAVGVPFVMSPVGVCAQIGENRRTHLNAVTDEDWYNSLHRLLSDPQLRKSMGDNGRKESLAKHSLEGHAETIARLLRGVVGS
jgi:glycosyltransferase involved in cell wall biosynthesis